MSLNVIGTWNDMEEIRKTLEDRKQVLITIDRKLFLLKNTSNILKAAGEILSTDYEIPYIFNGTHHYGYNTYNSGPDNRHYYLSELAGEDPIIYVYRGYNIEFFGVDQDFIHRLKAEIVVSAGPTTSKPSMPNFFVHRQDRASNQYEFYTTYADDPTHITLSKSIFHILNIRFLTFSVAAEEAGGTLGLSTFNGSLGWSSSTADGMVPFYTKLVINLLNTREFS